MIGNCHWKEPKIDSLHESFADVDSMADALRFCGFEKLIICKDADCDKIIASLAAFYSLLNANDYEVALVYYSGHGTVLDGKAYILPTDVPIIEDESNVDQFTRKAIPINSIFTQYNNHPDKTNFVIMDACRTHLIPGKALPNNEEESWAKDEYGEGTIIWYATSNYHQSYETMKGTNSCFTTGLLKHIRTPGLDHVRLFNNAALTTKEIRKSRNLIGNQAPEPTAKYYHDFYFVPLSGNQPSDLPETMVVIKQPPLPIEPIFKPIETETIKMKNFVNAYLDNIKNNNNDSLKILLYKISSFIANGADPNTEFLKKYSPIEIAISGKSFMLTKMLIEKGADINYHIDSFDDPIIIAIDDDNYQIVNLLLVNGAVTNALSEFGEPVLMCAAIRNNLQICKLLLEYGADINAENKKGLSVLDVASITIGYETQKTTDKFSSGKKLQASDELLNFLISKGAKHTKKYFKDYGYLDGK